MTERQFLVPKGTEIMRDQYHFSQGVKVGNTIYLSGQGGFDDNFQIAGPDVGVQARQAFKNIERVLKEAGASMDDVVEMTTFHVDVTQMEGVVEAAKAAFPNHCPAWTAVGVTSLAMPTMLIEIKAVAVKRG